MMMYAIDQYLYIYTLTLHIDLICNQYKNNCCKTFGKQKLNTFSHPQYRLHHSVHKTRASSGYQQGGRCRHSSKAVERCCYFLWEWFFPFWMNQIHRDHGMDEQSSRRRIPRRRRVVATSRPSRMARRCLAWCRTWNVSIRTTPQLQNHNLLSIYLRKRCSRWRAISLRYERCCRVCFLNCSNAYTS